MLKKAFMPALIASCMAIFSACDANQCETCQERDAELAQFAANKLSIINGTRVTGDAYLSTVAMVVHLGRDYNRVFCTGTLITPNYVLTAGHCISYCDGDKDNVEELRPVMRVGIGQSDETLRAIYEISEFYPHPKFECSKTVLRNDIAIVKLKEPVPLDVAIPTLPMTKELDINRADVDSGNGVTATTVGFGKTDANNELSSGSKYKTTYKVYAYCPDRRTQRSNHCDGPYTSNTGFIYFNDSSTGTCQGDSGGPTFFTRDGIDYVGGVTSYGYEDCQFLSAVTLVSDYYGFIEEIVDDLPAPGAEDCTNGVDDNNDDRIDCVDPRCYGVLACVPENCQNNKDDNGNGLKDCEDPQCADFIRCQPENCTNGIDDNDNNLIDCKDPECSSLAKCQPENCTNGVDDNDNGLSDCADPDCAGLKICATEVCDDGIDNNDDGKIDCGDPQCTTKALCQPEICNDNLDNNEDGRIDCSDPQCAFSEHCQPENCSNGIDDNANDLIDCADSQCAALLRCQPEICNDKADNNSDGLIDCGDPQCAESEFCVVTKDSSGSSDSCAATPRKPASPLGILGFLTLLGASLGWIRRRRVR